jgi:hypothetical protein
MSAQRLTGAVLVALLHIAIVALLLDATLAPRGPRPARETMLHLAPPPPPPPKAEIEPAAPRAPATLRLPDYQGIVLPPAKAEKLPENLGVLLFGCRPENISQLPPEQRALCAQKTTGLKPDGSVDFTDHTGRSRSAALWARGRARKNGPLLMPCASNTSIGVGIGTALCLANGVINGFKPDEQAIYGDRPQDVHVPNNGDPHPAYTDPDH